MNLPMLLLACICQLAVPQPEKGIGVSTSEMPEPSRVRTFGRAVVDTFAAATPELSINVAYFAALHAKLS
jgi:hypothetical protein